MPVLSVNLSSKRGLAVVWPRATLSATSAPPTLDTSDTYLGGPTLRFDTGTAPGWHNLYVPQFTGVTEGEIFVVVKVVADPAASALNSGLWWWGDNGGGASSYPNTSGDIVEKFGTDGGAGHTFTPSVDLSTQYRVYNCYSATNDWAAYIDNAL